MLPLPPVASRRDHLSALRDAREQFLRLSEDEQIEVMRKLKGQPIRHKDTIAVTFLRPGAREFLVECMGIARTCILTQGLHRIQEKVAAALDLPVQDVFGNRGDDQHVEYGTRVPQSATAILVDDMRHDSVSVKKKMEAIGLKEGSDRVVNVTTWEGKFGDPNVFGPVIKRIRQLVKN